MSEQVDVLQIRGIRQYFTRWKAYVSRLCSHNDVERQFKKHTHEACQ